MHLTTNDPLIGLPDGFLIEFATAEEAELAKRTLAALMEEQHYKEAARQLTKEANKAWQKQHTDGHCL